MGISSLKKTVKQLKGHADKKVAAAHQRAIAAIKKVKSHVKHMQGAMAAKEKIDAQEEKEKMVAAVKRVAGKATLALNAANVAAQLHKASGGAPAKATSVPKQTSTAAP